MKRYLLYIALCSSAHGMYSMNKENADEYYTRIIRKYQEDIAALHKSYKWKIKLETKNTKRVEHELEEMATQCSKLEEENKALKSLLSLQNIALASPELPFHDAPQEM